MKVTKIGERYYEEVPAPDGFGYRRLDAEEVEALLSQERQHELYVLSLLRPPNYEDLAAQEQWAIDKELGILDWDGSKPDHTATIPCATAMGSCTARMGVMGSRKA